MTKFYVDTQMTCTKRKSFESEEQCGTTIQLHGYFWCAQVCPVCLACYRVNHRNEVVPDFAGFWDHQGQIAIRANIAKNGGQYIPEFNR